MCAKRLSEELLSYSEHQNEVVEFESTWNLERFFHNEFVFIS